VKPETRVSLLAALSHLIDADSGGTSASVLGDAYQSIDSSMSARIIQGGGEPSRIHKAKLDSFTASYPSILGAAGCSPVELVEMYGGWLKARYENRIFPPGDLRVFVRNAASIYRAVAADIAQLDGVPVERLEESLLIELLGTQWATFDDEVARVHDYVQTELERQGESGDRSKLGNKMTNPSNFSRIMLRADDPVTSVAVRGDPQVAQAVGRLYMDFLKLVNAVDKARLDRGVEPLQVADYALSLRLRYHCEMESWAEEAGKGLAEALKNAIESGVFEKPSGNGMRGVGTIQAKETDSADS
jgi:hypothetical protein